MSHIVIYNLCLKQGTSENNNTSKHSYCVLGCLLLCVGRQYMDYGVSSMCYSYENVCTSV